MNEQPEQYEQPLPQRALGQSGLLVSALGLGCNAFGARIDATTSTEVIHAALDTGITYFDTADIYGFGASESIVGAALADRRDEVVLGTKCGLDMQGRTIPDWSATNARKYIRLSIEASLRRLGTDYVDLYQIHALDRITPFPEILETLTQLRDEGKILYAGFSNVAAWELAQLVEISRHRSLVDLVSVQNEYSLYNRAAEAELLPACRQLGIGLIPYFPLAYGLLTGKYQRDQAPPAGSRLARQQARFDAADFDRVEALTAFAQRHGVSLLEVALGTLIAQSAVSTVIAGATSAQQVQQNAAAARWQPTAAQLAELDEIVPPVIGGQDRPFAKPHLH